MFYPLLLLILSITIVSNAHAYLDPETGSGLMAFFIAIIAASIFYARKIFYFFLNLIRKSD